MTRWTLFCAALSTLLPSGHVAARAADPVITIATPTYATDGQVTGASSQEALQVGQTIVRYAYSGRTLCESSSATTAAPDDAGFGWRVQVTLLGTGSGLDLQVDWQRMWERGERLPAGPRGRARVLLSPGAHIVFDYLGAGERAISPDMAREAQTVGAGGCDAVGMALDISVPAPDSPSVVETNLWLVRTLPNGTEQSQHQVVRSRAGAKTEFFFDDMSLALADANGKAFFFFNGGGAPARYDTLTVRTSGALTVRDTSNGRVQMDLQIAQRGVEDVLREAGGSATFRLDASPTDVLSYVVPRIGAGGISAASASQTSVARFALRVQTKQIR